MKKKLLGGFVLATALLAFAACSRAEDAPEAGDYGATVDGYIDWIAVELDLDVDNQRILGIEVDFNMETQMFVDMMHPMVVDQILADQTTANINTRNGATVTTVAVIDAVNEVLARHGFDVGGVAANNDEDEDDEDVLPEEGRYTAVALGWANGGTSYIGVRVNIAGDRIDSIDFYPNQETPGFVGMMHPSIVDQIVANQSTEGIDTSNGATVTSDAVLAAVQEVLDRVGFVAPEGDDVNGDENGDEDITPPAEEDTPTPPTGDATPPAQDPTPEPPVAAGIFTPGTWTGSSNNTYSHNPDNEPGLTPTTLVVSVVTDDNNIVSITVTAHGESQAWVDMTATTRNNIIAANGTAGVSTQSGATYTSRAIIEATENALSQARR